ncbi:MAG TPA: xanthine dehydrogenase family protein subunit M [Actinomycetota bacterium]|nr:xanthine dehydrogenase family protein subunit M [Actinomycetota bacterium]
MLPAPFEYDRPETLDEALGLLAQHGEDAKVLAGGQSLIPLMKLRFAAPARLIDVNRIRGLDGIEERDGSLRIGAMVRHNTLAASDVIKDRYPTIAAAAPMISDPIVRNLGTIGGSLAHADPSGDLASVMIALGATVVARSKDGEREIAAVDLAEGPFQSSLAPTELLTEIRVPAPPPRSGGTYLKMERKVGDFATVAAAIFLTMENGSISKAGIGLTSVGLTNLRAEAAESSLAGAAPGDDAFAEAGRLAAEASDPATDVRGSADYKRHVVDVYVRRGLTAAAEMAGAA